MEAEPRLAQRSSWRFGNSSYWGCWWHWHGWWWSRPRPSEVLSLWARRRCWRKGQTVRVMLWGQAGRETPWHPYKICPGALKHLFHIQCPTSRAFSLVGLSWRALRTSLHVEGCWCRPVQEMLLCEARVFAKHEDLRPDHQHQREWGLQRQVRPLFTTCPCHCGV